jgi:branched-chain amino acid transport system permease protein
MKALIAAALVLLAAAPPFMSDWLVFLLSISIAKGMVVLGVTMLLRGGLISFGHALYYAAGAYVVGFAGNRFGIGDAAITLPLAALGCALLGAAVGLLLMRFRGIYFAMLSLAFSMILYTVLLKFYNFSGGTDGIGVRYFSVFGLRPPQESLRLAQYYLTLALGFGMLYTGTRFFASPLGALMQAVRYNEIRVEYLGASVSRAILASYVLSATVSGVGGALAAYLVGHVSPQLAYWTSSGDFVFVAVLGGTGSVFAPFAGSVAFEFIKNYAVKLSPETWQLTLGVVLLLIIFFLPQGLWSLAARLRERHE